MPALLSRRVTPFIPITRTVTLDSRNDITLVPQSNLIRVSELAQNRPNPFNIILDSAQCAALGQEMELVALRKLRFTGELVADGRRDWRLTGHLGATVVQPCVITLSPVTTRIEADLLRRYIKNFAYSDEEESEMPEDDTIEELGHEIDLDALLAEALALNLPLYPKLDDADLGEAVYTEPGKAAMRDEDARPFAGLAALHDQLKKDQDT